MEEQKQADEEQELEIDPATNPRPSEEKKHEQDGPVKHPLLQKSCCLSRQLRRWWRTKTTTAGRRRKKHLKQKELEEQEELEEYSPGSADSDLCTRKMASKKLIREQRQKAGLATVIKLLDVETLR